MPPGVDDFDRIASFNRTLGYCAVRDVTDAKSVLATGLPFMVTVPITKDWRRAKDGIIPLPLSPHSLLQERHAVLLCGYNDDTRRFTFRNSWGASWGDKGLGYLPYSYLTFYLSEAWVDLFGPQHREPIGPAYRPMGEKYTVYTGSLLNPIGYHSILT